MLAALTIVSKRGGASALYFCAQLRPFLSFQLLKLKIQGRLPLRVKAASAQTINLEQEGFFFDFHSSSPYAQVPLEFQIK